MKTPNNTFDLKKDPKDETVWQVTINDKIVFTNHSRLAAESYIKGATYMQATIATNKKESYKV